MGDVDDDAILGDFESMNASDDEQNQIDNEDRNMEEFKDKQLIENEEQINIQIANIEREYQ
jgi:hypothetical protein